MVARGHCHPVDRDDLLGLGHALAASDAHLRGASPGSHIPLAPVSPRLCALSSGRVCGCSIRCDSPSTRLVLCPHHPVSPVRDRDLYDLGSSSLHAASHPAHLAQCVSAPLSVHHDSAAAEQTLALTWQGQRREWHNRQRSRYAPERAACFERVTPPGAPRVPPMDRLCSCPPTC